MTDSVVYKPESPDIRQDVPDHYWISCESTEKVVEKDLFSQDTEGIPSEHDRTVPNDEG